MYTIHIRVWPIWPWILDLISIELDFEFRIVKGVAFWVLRGYLEHGQMMFESGPNVAIMVLRISLDWLLNFKSLEVSHDGFYNKSITDLLPEEYPEHVRNSPDVANVILATYFDFKWFRSEFLEVAYDGFYFVSEDGYFQGSTGNMSGKFPDIVSVLWTLQFFSLKFVFGFKGAKPKKYDQIPKNSSR